MKSYTDIEQSKKLAEILPIESADHHYVRRVTDFMGNIVDGEWSTPKYGSPNSKYANYIVQNCTTYETTPCWSLAALLAHIPNVSLHHTPSGWRADLSTERKTVFGSSQDEPVDACVDMVFKLKEKGFVMKALFLDFDGVITTFRTKYKIDMEKVECVMRILDATSAKVVVTSSWKHGFRNVDSFKNELLSCESTYIPDELKKNDVWKRFVGSIVGITNTFGSLRGDEIKKYIDNNDVDEYCILDDDSDMLKEQLFHFVQTDGVFGISDRDAELCIKILNGVSLIRPTRMNQVLTTMWRNHCNGEKNEIEEMIHKYEIQFAKETEDIKSLRDWLYHGHGY